MAGHVMHPGDGVLFHRKEGIDIHDDMSEASKHYAKYKEPDVHRKIIYCMTPLT